jgi:flavin reductase (DIM6/NTAB) family NADH-FMN oxidoreductase RutF
LNFKDVMSLVPTSVSILSCIEGSEVYGCTISSLVSIDISNSSPKIIFVLKPESLVGAKITKNMHFAISVLNSQQENLARFYSEQREPDNITDTRWIVKDNKFAQIDNACVALCCSLNKSFNEFSGVIFVADLCSYSIDPTYPGLIYNSRKYYQLP